MASDERFDIFDGQMVRIGTAARHEVHAKGLWHQTFHCWVLRRGAGGKWHVLLQLRHKDKDTHPGMLDISSAGHLLTGEDAADGVRELAEELGLKASIDELQFIGIIPQDGWAENGVIDREFCHVFLHECDQPLADYRLQVSEVSGLYQVEVNAYMELVTGNRAAADAEGILYDEQSQRCIPSIREIRQEDLSPNTGDYYETLFAAIKKKIHKQR